ncbi:MAG: TetR/AcrR family transcriptional regulator [Lachnospiraceae bacterium]|nr:TetR/AcrR family transcriptional regulator [Lachnospiraceae bacterium]
MPKIIENLDQRLIEEARKQIEESGYSAVTIRSVAKGCGVGVGTVYNYFPSKDDLVASFMAADWRLCLDTITGTGEKAADALPVLRCIYDQLCIFTKQHHSIIRDQGAAAGFAGSFGKYHGMLRGQLAGPLRKFCDSDFTADFIAESMLVWTMNGKEFEQLYIIIKKIL